MKSNHGLTMTSLVVYVASFLVVSGIIAGITSFFYNNISMLDEEVYSAAEYNKLNMYFVKETENQDNDNCNDYKFNYYGDEDKNVVKEVIFPNNEKIFWDNSSQLIYFSDSESAFVLCEGVTEFKVKTDNSDGMGRISVYVQFSDTTTYVNTYTMNS